VPITYRIDDDRQILFVTCSGQLTDDMVVGLLTDLNDDDRHGPGYSALIDFRQADPFELTPDGVKLFIKLNREHVRECQTDKVAIVADDPLAFGTSRMYEMRGGDVAFPVNVFRTYDRAMEWLA